MEDQIETSRKRATTWEKTAEPTTPKTASCRLRRPYEPTANPLECSYNGFPSSFLSAYRATPVRFRLELRAEFALSHEHSGFRGQVDLSCCAPQSPLDPSCWCPAPGSCAFEAFGATSKARQNNVEGVVSVRAQQSSAVLLRRTINPARLVQVALGTLCQHSDDMASEIVMGTPAAKALEVCRRKHQIRTYLRVNAHIGGLSRS